MRTAALVLAMGAAACGGLPGDPFLLESTACSMTLEGPGSWTDCRVYWTGASTNVLAIELVRPQTAGSFVTPGTGWAVVSVPGSIGNGAELRRTGSVACEPAIPASLGEDSFTACGIVATSGDFEIRSFELEDRRVALSGTMRFELIRSGGHDVFSYAIDVEASGTSGGSPADVVTIP